MTAGVLLAVALAGHFIGDWIVQTDAQAAAKASSWAANQRHMLGYHLTVWAVFLLVCIARGVEGPAWLAARDDVLVLIAVSWVTHSVIDRRWPVRWLMERTGSRPFSETPWGPLVVDQALHLAILCSTVAVVAG